MPATIKAKKSAQDIQDAIFQRMSADQKIELGSALWELAREIAPEKMTYEKAKPKTHSCCRDRNS